MRCPKCSHEQEKSDTCLSCGIVFAKYHAIQKRQAESAAALKTQADTAIAEDVPEAQQEYAGHPAFVRYLLQRAATPWNPVSPYALAGLSLGFLILMYLLATKNLMGSDSTLLYFLHNVNLVFHEAGHWIFAIFGNRTLTIFGGSLNQVLIPALVAASFWARRDAVGYAFALFWCFENLLDVAVYMADARALVLPLIGGLGEDSHDWRNLFFRFGLIDQDTAIAARTSAVGWIGMLSVCAWFLWRGFKSRPALSADPKQENPL